MIASASHQLNVLVMYNDPIVCAGLMSVLNQHTTFDVLVGGTDDDAPDERPEVDVVIADYDNAMQLVEPDARKTPGRHGKRRILAFTANEREADIRRAIQAGIHGYILLGGSLQELMDGVKVVGGGARYLCPAVAQRIADSLAGVTLTLRENEVLRLVTEGQSNKAIAKRLAIELGTVKSHVNAVMSKLGASSRTQAASIAVTRGLVDESRSSGELTSYSCVRRVDVRPFLT